ncbi:MAG: dephospho-CoA kinase [Bacteroidota bacterium]|jgi:dephospho-CoA kinase|nr:dephospho-CoA kinase [Bacteroidota bacterium]
MNTHGLSPLLIGLTGSIGAGKSTAAEMIRQHHPVLDADSIARAIMDEDAAVRAALVAAFGPRILHPDGTIDRRTLADTVFSSETQLARLNAIVHPPTIARIRTMAADRHIAGHRLVFVESALIFEAGIEEEFDYTVAVLSDTDTAITRVMARDACDRETAEARMRNQLPPEHKAALADFTIRNDKGIDELRTATTTILLILTRLGKRPTS